jgi:Tfp pilus assembly protein PilO
MAPPSKSGLAAQLSKQTPITKVGLLVVSLLLVGLVYWQFFLKDLRAEKKSAEENRQALQVTQQSLQKRLDDLEKLRQRRDALKTEVAGIEFALPVDAELNSFLDHVQTKAGDAGVSFKSWKNEPEVDAGKYKKVPLKVTVEGNFYQLMNYFYLLGPSDKTDDGTGDPAEENQFDRIVTIENLSLEGASLRNDEILLNASFTAATFRQPGAAPATPPPAPAPKKGAAAPPKKTPRFSGAGSPGRAADQMIDDTNAAKAKREADVKKEVEKAGGN